MEFMPKFPGGLAIGGHSIAPATVLAPMAGVTDTVFRRFIRNLGGCGLIMTEFTSSHGVVASPRRAASRRGRCRYLYFEPEEHPISAQLFGVRSGGDGGRGARSARTWASTFVDINFGCPVNKVVKCNGGSGLLRDLPLVEQILREVRAAISIPFTMKFRAGWNDSELVDCRRWRSWRKTAGCRRSRCIRARASRATAGAPTGRASPRSKAAVKIPVIGNGDIRHAGGRGAHGARRPAATR